ncbi:OLC1v1031257C1 [Oldenlandia corymbosa var. corymbosa]|uniref:OLC1v1031257C1 n=1 Tax=Oldenlandia corymbosa var. corymbosa TaxID=529605 RepID=A0AAV1CJP5_OLDCO|nr:OLC1v1031257C1 [Oldenlandia corymbosa var. corymbosa]
MKAVILRSGSGTIPAGNWAASNSPKMSVSLPVQESGGFEKKRVCSSSSISLQVEFNRRSIRRASSEPDIIRSAYAEGSKPLRKFGSRSFISRVPEEEAEEVVSIGSLTLAEKPQSWSGFPGGDCSQGAIPIEELGFSGGGFGRNWNSGGGSGDDQYSAGDFADRRRIGAYYLEMLKSDPNNPLLLRNYGKYLHEVERDMVRAQEYYGRAILASPGDGEVLSLYGKLIWETERDSLRAKSYLDQAVEASPEDCMVLGSYAHFMWEAEDEEEDEEDDGEQRAPLSPATMVEAF